MIKEFEYAVEKPRRELMGLSSRGCLRLFAPLVLSMLAMGTIAAAQAQTPPAQAPLVSRDGGGVKPNVMLTMDDSGSMLFQHMPENQAVIGAFTLNSPIQTNSINFDPRDNGSQAVLPGFFVGTIAATPGSTNWRQRYMRSADANTIYYNPEVRYLPWIRADGTRYAAASVTAARVDPDAAGARTIDLTDVRNQNADWCFDGTRTNCGGTADVSYNPGLLLPVESGCNGRF